MPSAVRATLKRARLSVLIHPTLRRWARVLRAARTPASSDATIYDVVFVTPPKSAQGWILDAICREIGARFSGVRVAYVRMGERLPPARRYFFSHYMYFANSISLVSPILLARSFVFATHLEPGKHGIDDRLLARALSTADGVICMNKQLREDLADLGCPLARSRVIVGAADASVYRPHDRQPDGAVGFCSAFYSRKSPDLIRDIVRAMPHRRFCLMGKGWEAYADFAQLRALPNFEYVDAAYSTYAGHYARMSVFVSASRLEGGPIPLLEAMMSNVVPVASRTGFAPDIILHGRNGFLFDPDAPVAEVCALIDQAFDLRADVATTVAQCDWGAFAQMVADYMDLNSLRTELPGVSNP